ncbi:MAG: tetratricopeptide repeat protein [Anaerolineae bacterium]|nr:tetratricopeptide repeat protein [Anaerolineae bacterium]
MASNFAATPDAMIEFLRLGKARLRALFLLVVLTGLASLMLNALDARAYPWTTSLQTLLALSVPVGAVAIFASALDPSTRWRPIVILLPVTLVLLLALVVEASLRLPLAGVALGWALAGWFLFRPRQARQVQEAIRALRRGRHGEALTAMDELIALEPDVAAHYRLRAEILRLDGNLSAASRDYRSMTRLNSGDASAWNGLAEVLLQADRHQEALEAARRAASLAPGDWVASYNQGMIEDRLGLARPALEHVGDALAADVPDARHRLLLQLYLARARMRLGDRAGAEEALQHLRRERKGLEEWQQLLAHEQAAPLRKVLESDIQIASSLMKEDAALDNLN